MKWCEHHACRCEQAAELTWMAEHLNRDDLLVKAIETHDQKVRCRIRPRNGAVLAPFPGERT